MGLYVSIDIETAGKDPARHAILSIGAIAVRVGSMGVVHREGEFYVNMTVPPNKGWDPDTKKWWDEQDEEARRALYVHPIQSYRAGTVEFLHWLFNGFPRNRIQSGDELLEEPIHMVFYPTSFDYRFLTHYVGEFVDPVFGQREKELYDEWFNHRETTCVDLQSMAMVLMQMEGYQSRRSNWPKEWLGDEEGLVAHNALDDARMQMGYFLNMMKWARENCPSAYEDRPGDLAEEGK